MELDEPYFVKFPLNTKPKADCPTAGGDGRTRYCKSLDVAGVGITNEEIPMLRIALRVRLRYAPLRMTGGGYAAGASPRPTINCVSRLFVV